MRRRSGAIALTLILAVPALPGAAKTTEPVEPLDRIEFLPVVIEPSPPPPPTIHDPIARLSFAPRPAVAQPAAKVGTISRRPSTKRLGRSISGLASWYCSPSQPVCARGYPPGSFVAAAGPQLRVAMGGGYQVDAAQPWRGRMVHVCKTGTSTCVDVKLVDWCQCYWKQSHEKLIDLYNAPFQTTGGNVTVSW